MRNAAIQQEFLHYVLFLVSDPFVAGLIVAGMLLVGVITRNALTEKRRFIEQIMVGSHMSLSFFGLGLATFFLVFRMVYLGELDFQSAFTMMAASGVVFMLFLVAFGATVVVERIVAVHKTRFALIYLVFNLIMGAFPLVGTVWFVARSLGEVPQ
ncbi:MAG TPA: hypothetical protein VIM02_08935 [Rhizomicrobium sp.]|jgi:hypothetical protein